MPQLDIDASSLPPERNSIIKELAKRRVYMFFAVLALVALLNTLSEESDLFTHMLDDVAIISISAIVLVFIGISWKKQELGQLRKQTNVIAILFVVALVFQIYGIIVELGDAADFANDIPSLVIILAMIINRFI